MNIVWRRDDTVVNNTRVTATTTMENLLVYKDSYTISPLSTCDDHIVYECRLVVHGGSGVRVNDSVRLNVTGECFHRNNILHSAGTCVYS